MLQQYCPGHDSQKVASKVVLQQEEKQDAWMGFPLSIMDVDKSFFFDSYLRKQEVYKKLSDQQPNYRSLAHRLPGLISLNFIS